MKIILLDKITWANGKLNEATLKKIADAPYSSTGNVATPCHRICRDCGVKLPDLFAWERHRNELHNPRRCEICGKEYHSRSFLKRHMTIHTGNRPFPCTKCERNFLTKQGLETHLRRHTGERPFECNLCDKAFRSVATLREHTKRHLGLQPHVCTLCNKTFLIKGQMKIHMRIHTGEKPFSCPDCGKCFSVKGNMVSHVRNVHEKNKSVMETRPTMLVEIFTDSIFKGSDAISG